MVCVILASIGRTSPEGLHQRAEARQSRFKKARRILSVQPKWVMASSPRVTRLRDMSAQQNAAWAVPSITEGGRPGFGCPAFRHQMKDRVGDHRQDDPFRIGGACGSWRSLTRTIREWPALKPYSSLDSQVSTPMTLEALTGQRINSAIMQEPFNQPAPRPRSGHGDHATPTPSPQRRDVTRAEVRLFYQGLSG